MNKIAPSILSCDFLSLGEEIKSINKADYIHIDVMDGHFVPNITIGPCVYKNLKKYTSIPLDVHLMISNPIKYAPDFIKAGSDILTFHYEAMHSQKEINSLITYIHNQNVLVGISIKPGTNVQVLDEYLDKIDVILIMSVEPGFGGQKFMEKSLEKIKYLSEMRKKYHYNYLIEVDGGINDQTLMKCKNEGCDIFVAGTYVFNSNNRNALIEELKRL